MVVAVAAVIVMLIVAVAAVAAAISSVIVTGEPYLGAQTYSRVTIRYLPLGLVS